MMATPSYPVTPGIPPGCARSGCGEAPSAHIGWALGHLYEGDGLYPNAEVQPSGAGATADKQLPEGVTWCSFVYDPHSSSLVSDFAGPDTSERCESPKHRFGEGRPHASWVEVLTDSSASNTVARCWKTCEACHVDMARAAERHSS